MRKRWQIAVMFVVTFILIIGGGMLTPYNEFWGFTLMLTGVFITWTWALWPDFINWFRNRK